MAKRVIVYLDNIIIFMEDYDSHCTLVEEELCKLASVNLKVRSSSVFKPFWIWMNPRQLLKFVPFWGLFKCFDSFLQELLLLSQTSARSQQMTNLSGIHSTLRSLLKPRII